VTIGREALARIEPTAIALASARPA
jgi:hypothetical protein